jgi:cytochrome c oxidase subunit II
MSQIRRQERKQRVAQQHRRRQTRRTLGYGTVVLAVLALSGWFVAKPLLRGQAVVDLSESTDTLVVRANMQGFQPKLLRARANTPITIQIVSMDTRFHRDGGGRHQFAIDELGVDIVAPPLGSEEKTFVISEPGTYAFYCSICCGGKANPSMWGRLIVES